jgi:antitoxin component YwqK of YwqJK toxin-antitoxin module
MSFIEYTVKIYSNGTKEWFLNGKRHREDGPAVEWSDGSKHWYLNGKLHREDGPAVEWSDGSKEWHLNGKLHREDGPAVEWSDGSKWWYLNGERMTEKEFNERTAPDSCEGKVVEIDGKKYRLTQLGEE